MGSDANIQKGACRKIQVCGKGSRLKIQLFFGREAPLKDTQRVPLKDTTFFQETGTSNRYTLGPVKRYNFFSNSLPHVFVITVSYIQYIPYTVYKVVPRKDTSFFSTNLSSPSVKARDQPITSSEARGLKPL